MKDDPKTKAQLVRELRLLRARINRLQKSEERWRRVKESLRESKDRDGNPRTSIIIRDITERKRVGEALTRERYLLTTLIDNIPDHIYFKDIHLTNRLSWPG